MNTHNVKTAASESTETSSLTEQEISCEAIRRALRRSLFQTDHPQLNVDTAVLCRDF